MVHGARQHTTTSTVFGSRCHMLQANERATCACDVMFLHYPSSHHTPQIPCLVEYAHSHALVYDMYHGKHTCDTTHAGEDHMCHTGAEQIDRGVQIGRGEMGQAVGTGPTCIHMHTCTNMQHTSSKRFLHACTYIHTKTCTR